MPQRIVDIFKRVCVSLLPITFTLLICAYISSAPAGVAEHPLVDIWLRMSLLLFVGVLALLYFFPIRESLKLDIAVGSLSTFLTATVFLTLKNTPYTFGGTGGDPGVHTAYVTKFAYYSTYIDFAYKDMPSFYPPLYDYILGKVSSLLHVAPFKMIKYGLLGTVFFIPYITQKLWSLIVDRKVAVVIAFSVLVYQDWYKPWHWISLTMFVPWWLCFIEDAGSLYSRHKKTWWFLVGGIVGSIIFQIYYYWFFIGGVSLILHFMIQRFFTHPVLPLYRKEVWKKLLMLGSAALFSCYYWGPCFYSLVAHGYESLQNRWFQQSHVSLPFPFMDFSVKGVFLMGGLTYLLLSSQKNRASSGLFNLFVSTYLWITAGYIGILMDYPLLASKAFDLIPYTLSIASLIALVELWEGKIETKLFNHSKTLFSAIVILLLVFLGQDIVQDTANHPYLDRTLRITYPDKLISAFQTMTNHDYIGKVMLVDYDYVDLLKYLPVYSFLAWDAHYSHPAALFHDRVNFLKKLSTFEDPALFATTLMNNEYSKIDYIMLRDENVSFKFTYFDDNFPKGTESKSIYFPKKLFSERYFLSREVDGYKLFVPLSPVQ